MKAKYINEFDEPGKGSIYNKLQIGGWHSNPSKIISKIRDAKNNIDNEIQAQAKEIWELAGIEFNKEYKGLEFNVFIDFMNRGYDNEPHLKASDIRFEPNGNWFNVHVGNKKTEYQLYAAKILITGARIYEDNGVIVNKLYAKLPKRNGQFGTDRPICELRNILTI